MTAAVLQRFEQAGWLSNTWLVAAAPGGPALLVDAGAGPETVLEALEAHDLVLEWVLLTHHHHDHCAQAGVLAARTGARVIAHPLEMPLFRNPHLVDRGLEDGQTLRCGGLDVRALHIPGHTAGQLAFLVEGVGVFTGDTLFRRSIGGTTAPGHTTFVDLRHSLQQRLLTLPEDTPVLPGHRLPSSIGEERRENPFLRVMLGQDPEGEASASYRGDAVRLVVWARDYDDGHKAWIRLPDGTDQVVPGSQVRR